MSWLASLKIVLISSGFVAWALAMKISVPMAAEFVASNFSVMCSSFRFLLRPPYLYFLVNGIIITIAASSRFDGYGRSPQPKLQQESEVSVSEPAAVYAPMYREPKVHKLTSAVVIKSGSEAVYEPRYREPEVVHEPTSAFVSNGYVEEAKPEVAENKDDHEYEDKLVIWPPKSMAESDEIALPVKRPLVSARYSHRKPARSSPEGGKPLRVAKPKQYDTLESTWKAITEGRSNTLSRRMEKSETFNNRGCQLNVDLTSAVDTPVMAKEETFKDRSNQKLRGAAAVDGSRGRLRKEPSLSQDELNRRAEEFINKFNEEMRLQRQKSLNQYMKMVNPGSH
ncbi:uncharacterized protein LOC125480404 [Pyrus x bretschneideri]|uniref:uncharacterized protein LOC125480404 n=1 Tax=Pyrus x bretschneideri TaxID=225117 RepID=UPI00202E9F71|nr:uncharacterized protein LOC125480404 [Pyrus x bretschneideri]